jgi:hypothetical protein
VNTTSEEPVRPPRAGSILTYRPRLSNVPHRFHRIEATGRLRSRTWTGNDGQERTEDELSAYRVQFVRMQPADSEAA